TIWTETVEKSTDAEYDEYDDYEGDTDDYLDPNSLSSSSNGSIQFVKELNNITRSSGKTLKLKCEVKLVDLNSTNSKVNFTWYRNSGHLPEDSRITVKNIQKPDAHTFISRLKITNLDYFDRGIYDCVASNGADKIRTQAFLEINRDNIGPVPEKVPAYKTTFDDSVIRENSEIDMTETTFFPGTDRRGRDELITAITKPLLPTLSEQTVGNPALFDQNGTSKSVAEKTYYNSSEPFCQLYVGKSCKNFLEGKYVFIQPPYTQRNIEEKLENAFLVIRQSNDISSSCEKFALPSLCFSAFPLCVDANSVNNYQESFINKYKVLSEKNKQSFKDLRNQLAMSLQRICKKDCELLENELCSKEYAIAKRHPVIRQTLELEECEYLPEENERNSLFCLRLGVDRTHSVNEDDTCFWDNGELYRGVQEVSVTGSKCIRWSHQFHIPLSEHPELSGHSFCRNPDGKEMEPFCYIDQNKKELCGLPKCARIIGIYIALTAVIFLVCVLVVLFIFCYKKRKAKKPNLQSMNIPSADKNIYGNAGPNSPMEMNSLLPQRGNSFPPGVSLRGQGMPKLSFQSVPQYTYKELSFVEELGEGAFGKTVFL
ncbi:inactive tyrosine-protein kinase transmembrane receptor ROR1-like, partial [Agrilus planipennis]|uniref:Inactive tyrosine-protein kinase transmembrane receptor ROR1-like n=1 Tax=Agrilus planipennis TaxID=224129 RepID=A0A7F5RFK3_AGRPL